MLSVCHRRRPSFTIHHLRAPAGSSVASLVEHHHGDVLAAAMPPKITLHSCVQLPQPHYSAVGISDWVPPNYLLRTSVRRHLRHMSSSRLLSGLRDQFIITASPWVDSDRLGMCLDYRRLALISSRVVHGGLFRRGCRPIHTSYQGDILVVPSSRRPASLAVSPRRRRAYAQKE